MQVSRASSAFIYVYIDHTPCLRLSARDDWHHRSTPDVPDDLTSVATPSSEAPP